MRRFLALGLAFFVTAAAAAPATQAQTSDELGYVNPRIVEGWFDEPPTVEVNLRGPLMKMVVKGMKARKENPEAAALLNRLKAIHVRIFETQDTQMETLEARSTELIDRLRRRGWETVVRVREKDEHVNIQTRSRDENTIAGLVVLVNGSDGESVFVNLVGDISPEEIGQLTGSIEGLDGLGRLGPSSDDESNDESDEDDNQ